MPKQKASSVIMNGIIFENPTFRLVLGICPTLAITTLATNAIGMGLSATFVLVFSNLVISALKDFIPANVRIPSFIVIIASFVTIVEMVLKAYFPALDTSLGIFIPLIVVNCIILARAEMFASKNNVGLSILDGLGTGIGFTLAITCISIVRELIGQGSFFCISLFGASFEPMIIFSQPPGGFITFGILLAIFNVISSKIKNTEEGK